MVRTLQGVDAELGININIYIHIYAYMYVHIQMHVHQKYIYPRICNKDNICLNAHIDVYVHKFVFCKIYTNPY